MLFVYLPYRIQIKFYLILSYLILSYLRPIALVTACSKIFESCLLKMLEHYLETHDHQFRFKSQYATDMCIFTVKSVIKY